MAFSCNNFLERIEHPMAPFYFLILGSLLLASFEFFSDQKQNLILSFSVLILIIFAGTRAIGIDPDGENYQVIFEGYSDFESITNSLASLLYEPIAKLIFFLTSQAGYGVEVVFLIFATLTLAAKEILIRRASPYPMLSVYLLCCHFYLYYEMVQIRAALAMSLVVISCLMYHNRKPLGILGIIFAAGIHVSALLGLAFLLLKEFQVDLKLYLKLLFVMLSIAIVFMIDPTTFLSVLVLLPFEKVDNYLDIINSYEAASIYGITLVHLIPILVGFWLVEKAVITDPVQIDLIRLYSLCIPYYWLFLPISVMAYRSSEFFQVVNIIVLPILISKLPFRSIGFCLLLFAGLGISYFTLFVRDLFPNGYASWFLAL